MLFITVSRPGKLPLQFSDFKRIKLPVPPAGIDSEINGALILRFEDESEAVDYLHALEDLQNAAKDKSAINYLMTNDVINAIYTDEFVQNYIK